MTIGRIASNLPGRRIVAAGLVLSTVLSCGIGRAGDVAGPSPTPPDYYPCPLPWKDGARPGTALDVSFLNEAPAGRHGFLRTGGEHFVFAGRPGAPVRFWGVNVAFVGVYPPKEDAPGIARAFAAQGVNLVRFHLYADSTYTPLVREDGSFDPGTLDRMDFFVAELKKNGIYIFMDWNDGMPFGRVSREPLPEMTKAQASFCKFAALFAPPLVDALKRFARDLFTRPNPYTGLAPVDDPVYAMVEIANEISFAFAYANADLAERLPPAWHGLLAERWRAWQEENGLRPVQPMPRNFRAGGPVAMRFAAEQSRAYWKEMRDYLREIGVKVPVGGSNLAFTLGDVWAAQDMDFANEHNYFGNIAGGRPLKYDPASAVAQPPWNPPGERLARARLAGKPLAVSEWNFVYPNAFRVEGLPYFAALAAYQGWDAPIFYCATGSFDAGRWERFRDDPGLRVHSQLTDPSTWGFSPACAIAFRRGDIKPAGRAVTLDFDPEAVWENRNPLARMPFLLGLARVATRFTSAPSQTFPMSVTESDREKNYRAALRELGGPATPECLRSDTGEIRHRRGLFLVDTPRTRMAAGELFRLGGEDGFPGLSVRSDARFAAFALTALDDRPLAATRRALLTAAGNSVNTGLELDGTTIVRQGKAPVLTESVRLEFTLPGVVRVHALSPLTGERLEMDIPVREGAFAVETGRAGTPYFELLRE